MSEMSRHTPGPWFLAEKVEGKHTVTNLRRIRSEREKMEHGAVCEVYGIADGSEAHANARLIAAAPELLEGHHTALQIIQGDLREALHGDSVEAFEYQAQLRTLRGIAMTLEAICSDAIAKAKSP